MPIATLADIVRHHRTAQPEWIALTFEERDTGYGALDRRANQVANGLLVRACCAGARIAVFDKNHDSFFEIWFGAAKTKAVLVPITWRLVAPEIAYIVDDAQAEMFFVGSEYLQTWTNPQPVEDRSSGDRHRPGLCGLARSAVRCGSRTDSKAATSAYKSTPAAPRADRKGRSSPTTI